MLSKSCCRFLLQNIIKVRYYGVQTNELNEKNTSLRSKYKMRGWQIHSYGNIDELVYTDNIKLPQIRSASDCLVRVHTTSVNPIDVALLGGYGSQVINAMRCRRNSIEFPLIMGREFCGEVVQRGMNVNSKRLSVGDRVWGVVPVHSNGAHADYVVVPDYCIGQVPDTLSEEEAASVLYGGLTAWSGLYITGGIGGVCGALTASGGGKDKNILVLGGSGNVGSLAIQLLKSQGAIVVTTCSSDAVELVKGIGANHVIDYKNPEEMETLRRLPPFDIILDCAGQGPKYAEVMNIKFKQYITFSSPMLRNIDNSGIGLGLLKNFSSLLETNTKSLSEQGGLVKWSFFVPAPQGIEFITNIVKRKKLLPIVDSRFTFDQIPEAFNRVKDGHLRGKVVVKL